MKKTLIAVAALAATTAFAQNVTVIGTVDATYRSTTVDYGNGTSGGQNAIGQNGSGTSNFTLIGTEDLGGGLKAIFNTEFDFDPSNKTAQGPIGGGQLFVGLEGAFGSIKAGMPNSPTLTVQGSRSAFGTKDGGRVGVATSANIGTSSGASVMGQSVTRTAGSLLYTTPNFSGFSAQLDYAPGNKVDPNAGGTAIAETGAITDIGAFYANGPIAAGVTRYTVAAAGTTSELALTSYYGSYDFKVAKVTVGGHQRKQDNAVAASVIDDSGYGAAVDVPLSPALTLNAHFVKVDDKATADLDTTMSAIGLNYALSKRTSTYVRYVNQKTDNATTAAQTKSASEYLVGVRHNF